MELRKKRRRNLVCDVPTRSHYQPHYLERVWYARVKGTTRWQLPLQQEGSTVPRGRLGRERGRGRAVMKQQQWLWPAPSWSARSPGVEDASRPAVPPRTQLVGTRGALQRARTQRLHLRGCSGSSPSRHLLGLAAWRAPQQVLGCSRVCVPRGASTRPCRRRAPHRLAFPSSLAPRCPVFIMQREITELVDFWFPFWTLLSSSAGLVRGPKHPDA